MAFGNVYKIFEDIIPLNEYNNIISYLGKLYNNKSLYEDNQIKVSILNREDIFNTYTFLFDALNYLLEIELKNENIKVYATTSKNLELNKVNTTKIPIDDCLLFYKAIWSNDQIPPEIQYMDNHPKSPRVESVIKALTKVKEIYNKYYYIGQYF